MQEHSVDSLLNVIVIQKTTIDSLKIEYKSIHEINTNLHKIITDNNVSNAILVLTLEQQEKIIDNLENSKTSLINDDKILDR